MMHQVVFRRIRGDGGSRYSCCRTLVQTWGEEGRVDWPAWAAWHKQIECSTLVAFTLTGIILMQAPRPRRPETPDQVGDRDEDATSVRVKPAQMICELFVVRVKYRGHLTYGGREDKTERGLRGLSRPDRTPPGRNPYGQFGWCRKCVVILAPTATSSAPRLGSAFPLV